MSKKNSKTPLCGYGCGQPPNNGQFKPGNKYGKGRPNGSKNNVTIASENLIEGEGEALTRKLIELALDGNVACLRHAIDRLHPVKRSVPTKIKGMPVVNDIESAAEASAFLLEKVSAGEISPQSAEMVSRLIDKYVSTTKWVDIEQELQRLA